MSIVPGRLSLSQRLIYTLKDHLGSYLYLSGSFIGDSTLAPSYVLHSEVYAPKVPSAIHSGM